MIIFGTRMFGGTDAVPDLFFVQTKFFHVNFLPLWPIQTYLVLQGRTTRAVAIPMSGKSIMVAWIRCIGGIVVLAALVLLMVAIFGDNDLGIAPAGKRPAAAAFVFFGLSCGLQYLLMTHGSLRRASHERAGELCSALGPTGGAALRRIVDRNFQQRVGIVTAVAVVQDDGNGEEGGGLGGGEAFNDLEFTEIFPSDNYDDAAPDDKRKTDGGGQLPMAKVLEVV
mmetsp:Transcript_33159/g.75007  ORF Transcript_33159/g.75007 Transcript_33159/m.75007 type:complete len:225 (-) Transcript_33159:174-848(-)